ncbi:MAG: glycoside hydrolase family 30 protein [Leifsonia sp.]|nr:glycoside hydrolase family 30 protein [Leifsonia sp.]
MRTARPAIAALGVAMVLTLSACAPAPTSVEVYSTTGSKSSLLARGSDLPVVSGSGSGNVDIVVDRGTQLQSVDGFGAAMTHSSATVLLEQTDEIRAAILDQLFSPTDGAGFSMVRLPIGTSDYAGLVDGEPVHYTYDDMPEGQTDEGLEHFSVALDEKTVIPIMQEALAVNPNLTIIGSPWSAPAWMKTTQSLYSGSLIEGYEDVYADYLVKYVEAYHDHGIEISYLTIQNEPLVGARTYPVMEMGEYQELSIIQKLGPKLASAGFPDVKVLAWDLNFGESSSSIATSYIDTVLGDPEAAKYTAGVAFHGYETEGIDVFGQGFQYVKDTYPGKMSMVTEITEGTWSRDFASNLSYALTNIVLGPLNYSSAGALYWNSVLYDDGTPNKGGAGTSLGVISVSHDGTYTKSSAYYAMAQISRFLGTENGGQAKVVASESSSPEILAVAIQRPDGRLAVVVLNTGTSFPETVNVVVGGSSFTAEIAAQSVSTFIY